MFNRVFTRKARVRSTTLRMQRVRSTSRSVSDPSELNSKGLSKREIGAEIKEREERILHILRMYKRGSSDEGKSCYSADAESAKHYVISSFSNGINYRDSSSDVCIKVTILGRYSYPDIDMTKSGTVCREELTGRIYDFDNWTIFYKNEPHSWVKLLDYEEREYYSGCMARNDSKDELYDKFIIFLSKDDLRDIRLGELGIE